MRKLLLIVAVIAVAVLAPLTFILGDSATAGHRGTMFQAQLSGANEVPPVDTDTSGKAKIRFNEEFTSAEFLLVIRDGQRITQAHIHCAPAGVNGPVIIFLAGNHANGWDVDGRWIDNATFTNANITNTACGATLAEIAAQMEAGNTYVNAHSTANPGGVVRGQLARVN